MMLPNGWKKVRLSEIGTFSKGSGIKRDEGNSGNIPAIRYGEIYTHHNDYIKEFHSFISASVAKEAKLLKKGDLLFCCSGETKEDIGKCVAFVSDCVAYAGGDIIIFTPSIPCDSKFIGYLCNSHSVNMQRYKYGQGDSIVHISSESIGKIELYLPPIEEQKKIAATLSVWDSAIEKMKKLIEAKESQKKALIKELIEKQKEKTNKIKVGKVTIDKNKWKQERIGNVLKIGHGRDYKGLSLGNVPVFGSGGYMTSVDKFLHNGETVCIGRKGTIDKPFYYKGKIWTVDTLFYTYDFKNVFPKFIYYVFCSIPWKIKNEAGGVPSLTSKIVENVEFYNPSLPEQQIIVDVLSNADEEISLLKQQLENYKKQKQGLMQKLLTGQWRVK